MNGYKSARIERRKARKRARKLLNERYGVAHEYLRGTGRILEQIAIHRPELAHLRRDERLAAFTGRTVPAQQPRPKPRAPRVKGAVSPRSDAFLESYEWRVARMKVLIRDGRRCACCGATPDDGLKMHVDHIKPRKTHPELALNLNNLQVLCEVCNHGKGNWDSTDWRKNQSANDAIEESNVVHIRSILNER